MNSTLYSFSSGFIEKLIDETKGLIPSSTFEKIISALQTEANQYHFTSSSESNLIRIFSAVYDKSVFFSELAKYPHHIEILIAISANSNYLTDIVVQNPEYLYQTFDQKYLSKLLDTETLQIEVRDGLEKFKSLPTKLNYLRQSKKRHILRIGLTDILGISDLQTITNQLSVIAKVINGELFNLCFNETITKYKLEEIKPTFCLCSLGKLGGGELNYSSDVDLILFFDQDFSFNQIKKEYHEILSETALLFIKHSTEITSRGYIYRVDFRLRPDGKYSPLCKSLSDYTKYYETRGEDWERQMLIKLDFIGGNEALYKQFYNYLQPYIFPSSFSSSIKDQIKKMKINIEKRIKEKDDVKHFEGGIRDIEFSTQALQLLNGSRIKGLRTGNTLNALSVLFEKNIIKSNEHNVYREAYIFYRRIEHYLQLMNDTQTHTIPAEGEILNKLANYMSYNSEEEFREVLGQYRKKVRTIYNVLMINEENETELESEIKYQDAAKADKNLKYLRSGIGIFDKKEFDARTISLFAKLEPGLIEYLNRSSLPDKVLDNFVRIIRATKFPSIWYGELSNSKFLNVFLNICEYSQKAVDLLTTDKSLEEFFLSRRVFIKNPKEQIKDFSVNQLLFLLSAQHASKLIDPAQISSLLGEFVTHKINSILSELDPQYVYFIGALGSYGSESMNFTSDIDLIIVCDKIDNEENIQGDFQKFVTRAQKELKPFEVDFRLRPEGNKSPIVAGLEGYKKYLSTRARVWEFQAFTKLKFVAGDKKLFNKLKKYISDEVKYVDQSGLAKEIVRMFNSIQKEIIITPHSFNIKKQKGGISTIDFLLQYLLLKNPNDYKKSFGKNIPKLVTYLQKNRIDNLNDIKANYLFLREIEFALQNIFNSNSASIPTDEEKRKVISQFLNLENNFSEKLNSTIKSNIILYDQLLGI